MKNKIKLKDLLQTLPNGHEVFDFAKIDATGFPVVIVSTERGAKGKTYNVKDFIQKEFIKNTDPYYDKVPFAAWIRNTQVHLSTEHNRFLREVPEGFKGAYFTGTPEKDLTLWGANKKPMFDFINMTGAENQKGTRSIYKYMVWDEFNVGQEFVSNITFKFDSLLLTTMDPVNGAYEYDMSKIFIFGNSKTINHPLLISMGVFSITEEITEIYDDYDNPLILIIKPVIGGEERQLIEEKYKNNWRYNLANRMGTAESSFFNNMAFDDTNYVFSFFNHLKENLPLGSQKKSTKIFKENLRLHQTIFHDGKYFNIYSINPAFPNPSKSKFHVIAVEAICKYLEQLTGQTWKQTDFLSKDKKGSLLVYSIKVADRKEGVLHAPSEFKANLIRMLGQEKFSFEDILSRHLFISAIK